MPIQVQGPDGQTYEFPDNTSREVMRAAMQKRYGDPQKADFSNVQGQARTMADRYAAAGIDTQPHDPGQDGGIVSIGPFDTGIKTPPWLDREIASFGRGSMLGARATMEGAAAIPDMVSAPFRFGLEKLTGQPQATYGGLASRFSDWLGLPTPQTPRERIASDIGRALSGTAVTMGIGGALPAGSRVGSFLTQQPMLQAASATSGAAASGITREAGGSPTSQFIASLVGGLAPGVATYGAETGLLRLLRGGEKGRQAAANAVDDFASVGATPSVGQAAGNWRTQGLESLLAGGPTSGGIMARYAEQQAHQMGSGLASRAEALSRNASAESAGRAIEQGAQLFSNNTKVMQRGLYWQADQFIPGNTPVPLSNTWQKVVQLTAPNPGATATTGAMVNGTIAKLRDTLEQDLAAGGGRITYDALKRIRTDIGEAISDYSLSPDTPTREYKALYAALSRDMEEAAKAKGPAAVAAAQRANNYTRAAADRLEQIDRVVSKAGGPEKVYSAVMSGTQDGGTTLRAVMQSLPPEGQKAVTAAVIKRMGLATPGQQDAAGEAFSAGTFLTNWNRISPEARRALFDRYGPGFSANMDKIARVAERIRTGSKVFANPSGTANKAGAYTFWTSLAGAGLSMPWIGPMPFISLVAGGAGANLMARFMTDPSKVAWLARNAEKPVGAVLGELSVLAQKDPDMAQLYDELRKQPVDQPANANGQQRQNQAGLR